MAFQLRILSGKHKGAEIRLETRRYSLGSGEENTLILSDSSIEKKHISFFFAEGEISVLSADGGLLVDGVKVDKLPIDVAPLQVMTLAVKEHDGNAADNVSIAFRETRASDSDANREGEGEGDSEDTSSGAGEAVRDWPDDKKIEELLLKNSQQKDPKGGAQKTRQAEKKIGALARMGYKNKKMLVRSTIAIVLITATIALVSIASLLWFDPVRWQAQRMKKVEKRLEKELAAKPQKNRTVQIAEQKDGSFVLLGYVETEKELVRLRGLAFDSGLQIRVVSKEQLKAAVEVIARQYNIYANFKLVPVGKPSTIETKNKENRPNVAGERKRGKALYSFEDLQTDGERLVNAEEFNELRKRETQHFKLRVEGFVEHERRVEPFRKTVLQDLPYITEVEMDVTTNEVMLEAIRDSLSKNIAFSGVRLNLQLGQLVMSGAIFANFHDELQDILQKQYRNLPHAPVPKDRITLAPPFYAKITALLLGRQRAVDLRMRKDVAPRRYLVGQVIDNDKQIVAIASNGIILKYRDKTLGFPIANSAANSPNAKVPAREVNENKQSRDRQNEDGQNEVGQNEVGQNEDGQNEVGQNEVGQNTSDKNSQKITKPNSQNNQNSQTTGDAENSQIGNQGDDSLNKNSEKQDEVIP